MPFLAEMVESEPKKKKMFRITLLAEITPMPNSFLPKLISYLHIKGNERHITEPESLAVLVFFTTRHLVHKKKRQRALENVAKGGPLNAYITRF